MYIKGREGGRPAAARGSTASMVSMVSTPLPPSPGSSRYPRLYGGACVRLASTKSAAAVYYPSEWLKTKCVASLPFLVTSTERDPSEREATPLDRYGEGREGGREDRSGLFPPFDSSSVDSVKSQKSQAFFRYALTFEPSCVRACVCEKVYVYMYIFARDDGKGCQTADEKRRKGCRRKNSRPSVSFSEEGREGD